MEFIKEGLDVLKENMHDSRVKNGCSLGAPFFLLIIRINFCIIKLLFLNIFAILAMRRFVKFHVFTFSACILNIRDEKRNTMSKEDFSVFVKRESFKIVQKKQTIPKLISKGKMEAFMESIYQKVLITSGGTTIISSGTAISFNKQPIAFDFIQQVNSFDVVDLSAKFEFAIDLDDKTPRMVAETPSAKEIVFKLINFTNPLGSGTKQPVQIASHGQNLLFFVQFFVRVIGESSYILEYCIYQQEVK